MRQCSRQLVVIVLVINQQRAQSCYILLTERLGFQAVQGILHGMPRNLEHRSQTLYLLHPLAEFFFIDLADGR